jgi:GT2 family glycosyltransferase
MFARRFPAIRRYGMAALGLRRFEQHLSFLSFEQYQGWHGDSEREVDWQSGSCVTGPLRRLGGFDEQFFYHFKEVGLCRRLRDLGLPTILNRGGWREAHLVGQSVNRFPVRAVARWSVRLAPVRFVEYGGEPSRVQRSRKAAFCHSWTRLKLVSW